MNAAGGLKGLNGESAKNDHQEQTIKLP